MNREGAETYLRVLAEAELRGSAAAALDRSWRPGGRGEGSARMTLVAQALTAVHALDEETTEDILAGFDMAARVREHGDLFAPARPDRWLRVTALRRARGRLGRPAAGHPEQPAPGHPQADGPDRFVPIWQPVPFTDEGAGSELYLMSYAHTGSGTWFTAMWRLRDPSQRDLVHPGTLGKRFTVTDARGGRYDLDLTLTGDPESTGQVGLNPDPPDDIRWLDIAAPGHPAVRVSLGPVDDPGTRVSAQAVSPGEQLLIMFAERLFTSVPGPLTGFAAGLGDVIAALEAAEVLSPLSPVPGWLATLCESLRISGHGITAPPALDLPRPWLSLLAHYGRRKPETAPVRDGCASVAVALPELDGIGLVLLGLYNSEGSTWIHTLVRGLTPELRPGPFGIDMYFPLSVWLRDSGGRWHAARPAGWHRVYGEVALRLQFVPPLPRSADWIEVRAAGRSAQARVTLPLRWGCPP
jgi:hypothetical protein